MTEASLSLKLPQQIDCFGCSACESICPHRAIDLQPDKLGFLHPVVDRTLCIDCHLCERVCPSLHQDELRNTPLTVVAARHQVPAEVSQSRSGGAFWALAQAFIYEGVIYGACFDTPSHIVHRRATTLRECQQFRGSKYAQSDQRGIFSQIRKDLEEGRQVMFTGTPCQVAGLKRYVPDKLAERLTTIDLVCHGSASPRVWSENIRYIEHRHGSTVTAANFRDKRYGWSQTIETYQLSDGREVRSSLFSRLYCLDLIERECCSRCPFTNLQRCGDITIGDFWHWEKLSDEWNDDCGVSLITINSPKGQTLFDKAKVRLSCRQSNLTACLQPQLEHPLTPHAGRSRFISDLDTKDYEHALAGQSVIGWKAQLRSARYTIIGTLVEAKNRLLGKITKRATS